MSEQATTSTPENRDSIDFGQTDIKTLFIKMFIPTLMGLVFNALLNIADGIFVGKGVSSDALAAVNIAAPIFLIVNGISLMFGSGVSIVAAIHLSHKNYKAASINLTQAFIVTELLMVILSAIMLFYSHELCYLFGGTARLEPLVVSYLHGIALMPILSPLPIIGLFVVRLDGSPKYAMVANITESICNCILDYVFVFPLAMGVGGAAIATTISVAIGGIIIAYYMIVKSRTMRIYPIKWSKTGLKLTQRNIGYMSKLGFSSFLGEIAICGMIITGNYQFGKYLQEDGVAAFSVACYLFPLIFMFGNSIAQSAQPIISYNHGLGNQKRIDKTLRLAFGLAIVCGIGITLLTFVGRSGLLSLFLDKGSHPYELCYNGFPYYSLSFLFFTLNLVLIGYHQGCERAKLATLLMLLRGFILVIPCFLILPVFLGQKGLWLAQTTSEVITCIVILFITFGTKKERERV